MDTVSKADEILDVAERMARSGGYNGFSFREIATSVGVKSSSVHYHFPTKQDLAAAVARRYTDRFLNALGEPSDYASAEAALDRYIEAYRHALIKDGLMCLCGIMGAEADRLPPIVRTETKNFFERNIEWLVAVYAQSRMLATEVEQRRRAAHIVATLEGAIILARTVGDNELFEHAASGFKALPPGG